MARVPKFCFECTANRIKCPFHIGDNGCKNRIESYQPKVKIVSKKRISVVGKLGDVKFGKELGLKAKTAKFIWTACNGCGRERWVVMVRDKPVFLLCHSCGISKGHKKRFKLNCRHKTGGGYVHVSVPHDSFYLPMVNKSGYVLEHRLVMAHRVGRLLEPWEVVHHINGIKDDNRIENLELLPSSRDHSCYTIMQKRIRELEKRVTILEAENALLKVA